MTASELIGRLDHSLLKPDARVAELVEACEAAKRDGYNSLCVSPWLVEYAKHRLGDDVPVGAVVGFPHGTSTIGTKSFEAEEAVRNGAALLDVALSIGRLKSNEMDAFTEELAQLKEWVERLADKPLTWRGIIESGLLGEAEADQAALAVMEAGWQYVKTSTGFGPRGAETDEVRRLASLVSGRAKVKAAGGIRTGKQALAMFGAGADIVGTGAAPAVAQELREMESRGELQD